MSVCALHRCWVNIHKCTANDSKALQNLDKQILYFRIGYYAWHVCV